MGRLLDIGGDVLLKEKLATRALRAAHNRERAADDMRRHKIPHAHVIRG